MTTPPEPSSESTSATPAAGDASGQGRFSRQLLALILGQISLHACATGLRLAAPLQALHQGQSAMAIGILLALFAIGPVALAMPAGRMADRHGYHRPLYIAVGLALCGGVAATLSSHYLAMCLAALLAGAGANIGMITIQHRAGSMAGDNVERIRIFSWLGLAPALSNVIGPVAAGVLIDLAGFRVAFGFLTLLPLAALAWSRWVPREKPQRAAASRTDKASVQGGGTTRRSLELLRTPAMRRLLLVNCLLSASWDVHTFALPILGHERGLSASEIGAVLGLFAFAVAMVRLLIPLLSNRLSEAQVLTGAMLSAGAILAVYPLAHQGWSMALAATFLGMALGAVQPMIMSKLHQISPANRHGEAIGLRSAVISLSSSVLPLLFGLLGATIGASSLFWLMAAAVGSGSLRARRL